MGLEHACSAAIYVVSRVQGRGEFEGLGGQESVKGAGTWRRGCQLTHIDGGQGVQIVGSMITRGQAQCPQPEETGTVCTELLPLPKKVASWRPQGHEKWAELG